MKIVLQNSITKSSYLTNNINLTNIKQCHHSPIRQGVVHIQLKQRVYNQEQKHTGEPELLLHNNTTQHDLKFQFNFGKQIT